MRTKFNAAILITVAVLVSSCAGRQSSGGDKAFKTTKSDDLTITLLSSTAEFKQGEGEVMLSFADGSGKPVDVGAASLKFHMPAMGSMAEMNEEATLTTTSTPGRYRARIDLEMAGSWEAIVSYQGPHGTGQASMTVIVK